MHSADSMEGPVGEARPERHDGCHHKPVIASLSCTVFSSVPESKPREPPLLKATLIPVPLLQYRRRSHTCHADVQTTTTSVTPSFVRLPTGNIASLTLSLSPFTSYYRIFNFESIHSCPLPVHHTPLSTKPSSPPLHDQTNTHVWPLHDCKYR